MSTVNGLTSTEVMCMPSRQGPKENKQDAAVVGSVYRDEISLSENLRYSAISRVDIYLKRESC